MTEHRISLAPNGALLFHCNERRALEISPTLSGMKALIKLLRDEQAGVRNEPGYIGAFPTQAVIEAWQRQDRLVKREQAEAAARAEAELALTQFAERGVDVNALDISL